VVVFVLLFLSKSYFITVKTFLGKRVYIVNVYNILTQIF